MNSAAYVKSPLMVSREIEGEMILVPIRQKVGDLESIYTLNEVGARIWELLDGQRTMEQITEAIASEYEVGSEEASRDVVEFLGQLEEIGGLSRG